MQYANEVMRVLSFTADGAIMVDSRGDRHIISVENGLFGKDVRRGEFWTTSEVGYGIRTLDDKVGSPNLQVTQFSMLANAERLVGSEKQFVDDMLNLGVDSVLLTVAAGGEVHWDFPDASEYGLSVTSEAATKVVSRLNGAGIGVTLLVSFDLWGATSKAERYCQMTAAGGYSRLLSPIRSERALFAIFSSLRDTFPNIHGVGLSDVRLDGFDSDFSPQTLSAFRSETGIVDDPSLFMSADSDNRELMLAWRDFKATLIPNLCRRLGARVAVCHEGFISDYGNDQILEYGVCDDSAELSGDTVFTCTIDPEVSSSRQRSMGSTMFRIAMLRRAAGASLMVGVPVGKHLFAGVLDAVLDSRVPTLVFDGYDQYRSLSVADREELARTIATSRVGVVGEHDVLGVYIDRVGSLLFSRPLLSSVERISVDIMTKHSVDIRIYSGDDIPSAGDVSAFLLYDTRVLSDDFVSAVSAMIREELLNVVIVGKSGYNDSRSDRVRLPFPDAFGAVHVGYYGIEPEERVEIAVPVDAEDPIVAGVTYGKYRDSDYGSSDGLSLQQVKGGSSVLAPQYIGSSFVAPALLYAGGSRLLGMNIDAGTELEALVVDLIKGASSR